MHTDRHPPASRSPSAVRRPPAFAVLLLLGQPGLAAAHGDDTVTGASFYGPLLALAVLLFVVPLGKALLRLVIGRR